MLIDKNELEQLKVKLHSRLTEREDLKYFAFLGQSLLVLFPFGHLFFLQIFNLIVKSFGDLSALVWRAWLLPDIFLCPTTVIATV